MGNVYRLDAAGEVVRVTYNNQARDSTMLQSAQETVAFYRSNKNNVSSVSEKLSYILSESLFFKNSTTTETALFERFHWWLTF